MLNNDNEDSRKMVEQCYKQNKTVVNPIIDWSTEEVWEFIKEYNIPYCKLYDEGCKRLGCVGCPMGYNGDELDKYPKYKQAYIRAFDRMLKNYPKDHTKQIDWKSGQDVYDWWIRRKGK